MYLDIYILWGGVVLDNVKLFINVAKYTITGALIVSFIIGGLFFMISSTSAEDIYLLVSSATILVTFLLVSYMVGKSIFKWKISINVELTSLTRAGQANFGHLLPFDMSKALLYNVYTKTN